MAAAKATGGMAPERLLRGRSRITAAAQKISTRASGDLERAEPPARKSAEERDFTE
jgi:hypothetical protein